MNRNIVVMCGASIATLCWPSSLLADDAQRDVASETRAVFAAKCIVCHGPDLAKPKGRFGYVTDLARVASNREMVVPSSPEESELWDLVQRNEMPPADSPAGPLSPQQKDVIRAWIAAGAPSAAPAAALPSGPPSDRALSTPGDELVASLSVAASSLQARLGRFHILVVHFPIGLLISAVVAEAWSAWRGNRDPSPPVSFCVRLGAVSAVAAALLGWLHAWNGYGVGMPLVLALHRWSGTVAALWAIGAAWFSERDERRGQRSQLFRVWLLAGALLVAATGHFGGSLVHGEGFLTGQ